MASVVFHAVVVPGAFLLGWLVRSVKIVGFHSKLRVVRESSN
jgi:hypothetical protein